jgi:hypothetical protein
MSVLACFIGDMNEKCFNFFPTSFASAISEYLGLCLVLNNNYYYLPLFFGINSDFKFNTDEDV